MLSTNEGSMTLGKLWKQANDAKNLFEWLSYAGAIWMPSATSSLVRQQDWDIIALYALAGLGFWIVYIVELEPYLSLRLFPTLELSPTLAADGEMDMFRLPIRCASKRTFTPTAHLEWIEVYGGQPEHQQHTPLELRWRHRPDMSNPQMSWDSRESVDVAALLDRGTATERLIFMGKMFQAHTLLMPGMNQPKHVTFCVRVRASGALGSCQERVFRMERDETQLLGWRPARLPNRESIS